jgi:hypothetical protein
VDRFRQGTTAGSAFRRDELVSGTGPSDPRLRAQLEALERSAPFDLPRLLGASGGAGRRARWLPTAITLIAGAALGIAGSQLLLNWPPIGERYAGEPSASAASVGQLLDATVPPGCPITKRPDPLFVPPAAFPSTPPGAAGGAFWYGTMDLWTVVNADGSWGGLRNPAGEYENKSFWWSVAFKVNVEPEPALQVTGRRLDAAAETARSNGATNAGASDIGSAMLTGVTVPTSGCWELTGHYRGHELSYVFWIPGHGRFRTVTAVPKGPCLALDLEAMPEPPAEVTAWWWDEGNSGDCSSRTSDVIRTRARFVRDQSGYQVELEIGQMNGGTQVIRIHVVPVGDELQGEVKSAGNAPVRFVQVDEVVPTLAPPP